MACYGDSFTFLLLSAFFTFCGYLTGHEEIDFLPQEFRISPL
jgi:hypothetical protein